MTVQFRPCKARLRVGMSGPSGSGKTYSGLLIARGLTTSWDKLFLIDTENASAELHSDLGDFRVYNLQAPFSPQRYIEAIT
jgi:adenylylsulfate kinase-like enzyme